MKGQVKGRENPFKAQLSTKMSPLVTEEGLRLKSLGQRGSAEEREAADGALSVRCSPDVSRG